MRSRAGLDLEASVIWLAAHRNRWSPCVGTTLCVRLSVLKLLLPRSLTTIMTSSRPDYEARRTLSSYTYSHHVTNWVSMVACSGQQFSFCILISPAWW